MLNVPGALRASLLAMLLAGTVACARQPPAQRLAPAPAVAHDAQVAWVREALARNPDLEVLAVDPKGVFTVRLRANGGLRTFGMNELMAGPVDTPAGAPASANAPASPEAGLGPDDALRADAGAGEAQVVAPSALTFTRDAGRISINGPGISIAPAATAGVAASPAAATPLPPTAEVERRGGQPLVCQGERLMRIDGRVIEFDGDGLIVQDGCDLYLTNSRISAGGIAVTVTRGKVHVVNSTVEGGRSSIEASQGAQVYLSGASIDGLQRRFDTAQINDLGGNRYR